MILEDIKNKLQDIDEKVFYGAADDSMRETLWNYTVFDRKSLLPNQNRTSYSYYYSVHIVRENFIPDGLEVTMINKMLEIAGMRLAGNEGTYDYIMKPNTNIVVEMFTIDFVRAVKE